MAGRLSQLISKVSRAGRVPHLSRGTRRRARTAYIPSLAQETTRRRQKSNAVHGSLLSSQFYHVRSSYATANYAFEQRTFHQPGEFTTHFCIMLCSRCRMDINHVALKVGGCFESFVAGQALFCLRVESHVMTAPISIFLHRSKTKACCL
jgi:hypothetical protein